MVGLIKLGVGLAYAGLRVGTAEGTVAGLKSIVQDVAWVFKLPVTLWASGQEATANHEKCLKELKETEQSPFSTLTVPVKSLQCDAYKYQSVLYGLGALYVAYKIYPYAKSLWNMAFRAASSITPARDKQEVIQPSDQLNRAIQFFGALAENDDVNVKEELSFLKNLSEENGLNVKDFSYNETQGWVVKMTTNETLSQMSKALTKQEIGYKNIVHTPSRDLIKLLIEREGYKIHISTEK